MTIYLRSHIGFNHLKMKLTAAVLILAFFIAPASSRGGAPAAAAKPNILLIVADDLGFSDLGCYGSEISTPNLDALAKNGLRFTQFYNTGRCWPTRAAILTGYYAQQVRRDTVPGIKSGSDGTRPKWAPMLPELLRAAGYRSYHSGKWHLDGKPMQNGFDHSYSLNDHDRNFTPRMHTEDDKPLPAVAPDAGYYSTTAIADHAIKCLKDHALSHAKEPFFEFLAFTSPHFPLQAPAQDVARYRDRYSDGWDKLRERRWQRMRRMGLLGDTASLSSPERELGPPYDFPKAMEILGPNEVNRAVRWKDLTSDQKRFQADKMSVHAAMVDRMDREIGRVLAQIRAMGALENTVIFFLSDNGASAEMMVRGDGHDREAICGTAATFLSLGPGWSTMANTPFRRHKTWTHEGGIATPLIVHWPRGISASGELRRFPGHVVDLLPTILELAGAARPETWNGQSVPRSPGKSLIPTFATDSAAGNDSYWWLHEGNRALRLGRWKIVASGKTNSWELYDLARDRSETKNLAGRKPEIVNALADRWNQQTEEYFARAREDAP
jgi:arylsulfatase A-like enzyme